MSKSCTTPGQEPAAFRTWPVNVLSARQAVQKYCSYVSASVEEATPRALWQDAEVYNSRRQFLYVGSRSLLGLPTDGPLQWCSSVPFDLATSSLGTDFFK